MKKLLPLVLLGALLLLWFMSQGDASQESGLRSATPVASEPAAEPVELSLAQPVPAVRESLSGNSTEAVPASSVAHDITICATVVNPDGTPIQGVELMCLSIPELPSVYSDGAGEIQLVVFAPDLRRLQHRPVKFRFQSPSTVGVDKLQSIPHDVDTHLGRFTLQPGGTLTGRVLAGNGQPVRGAIVCCVPPFTDHGPEYSRWLRVQGSRKMSVEVKTNGNGEYVIPGVLPGSYSVQASTGKTLKSYSTVFTVHVGQGVVVPDLILESAGPGSRIEGVVLDKQGLARSGVSVALMTPDGSTRFGRTSTDDQGAFVFIVIPGAVFEVRAGQGTDNPLFAYDVPSGTLDLVLQPYKGGMIKVIARTARGEPIPGFSASAHFESGKAVPGSHATSPEGKEVALVLPEMPFAVRVHASQYGMVRSVTYDPNNPPALVEVVLEPAPGLRGRVVMNGRGVAGAWVEAEFVRNRESTLVSRMRNGLHNRLNVSSNPRATSDTQGYFLLGTDLDRTCKNGWNQVHLQASALGYTYGPRLVLNLQEGVAPKGVVLELGHPGAMRGRVRSAKTVNYHGMIVAISRGDHLVLRKTLVRDGAYSFDNLTPGLWQAVLEPSGKLSGWGDREVGYTEEADIEWSFEVQSGLTTEFNLAAKIEERIQMSLRVELLVNGLPPVGWSWRANDQGEQLGQGPLDADGRFLIEVSGTDSFSLSLRPPDIAPYFYGGFYTRVKLREGERTWNYNLSTSSLFLTGLPEPAVSREDQQMRMFKDGMWSLQWEDSEGELKWKGGPTSLPTEGLLVPNVPVGTIHWEKTVGYEREEHSKFTVETRAGHTTDVDLGP